MKQFGKQHTAKCSVESFTCPHLFYNVSNMAFRVMYDQGLHHLDLNGFFSKSQLLNYLGSFLSENNVGLRIDYIAPLNGLEFHNEEKTNIELHFDIPNSVSKLFGSTSRVTLLPDGRYASGNLNLLSLPFLKLKIKELTSPFYQGSHRDDSTVLCLPVPQRFTELITYSDLESNKFSATRNDLYGLTVSLTDHHDQLLPINERFHVLLRIDLVPDEFFREHDKNDKTDRTTATTDSGSLPAALEHTWAFPI